MGGSLCEPQGMKLIGATNVFVRATFIIEGVIIGAVGSAIPLVLLYYMYDKILTCLLYTSRCV